MVDFLQSHVGFQGCSIPISLTELLGSLGLKHQRTPAGMASFQNKPQLAGHVIVGKKPHVGVVAGWWDEGHVTFFFAKLHQMSNEKTTTVVVYRLYKGSYCPVIWGL